MVLSIISGVEHSTVFNNSKVADDFQKGLIKVGMVCYMLACNQKKHSLRDVFLFFFFIYVICTLVPIGKCKCLLVILFCVSL